MDWRELWRLRLANQAGALSPAPAQPAGDEPPSSPDEEQAVRTRFFFVVARTRLDLFLTIRRQFRDDRTVYVMLDRREQERRGKARPVDFPDRRRQPDRRRPLDYWEDPAHHPVVLVPLSRRRPADTENDAPPSPEAPPQDKEPVMEHTLVDESRVLAWVQEGQHVFQHVLPTVLTERDTLKTQLYEATRRCQALQEENDRLRAEMARASADHRQLQQGHADIVDSVSQFLAQLSHVLDPMRDLTAKLGQARPRPEGTERAG
jgi:hypothetical protein